MEIAFSLLSSFVDFGVVATAISQGLFLVFGVIAGVRAAKYTRKISTGMIAGLIAGVVGGLMSPLVGFGYSVIYLPNIINAIKV